MLSGDMARYQIADRVREAEAARLAKSTRRAKSASDQSLRRRIGRAPAAALWPTKHLTIPTSSVHGADTVGATGGSRAPTSFWVPRGRALHGRGSGD